MDNYNIKIFDYDLEPNPYKDVEIWKNVTIIVTENLNTGEQEVRWRKQPNSQELDYYPWENENEIY